MPWYGKMWDDMQNWEELHKKKTEYKEESKPDT